MGQSIVRKRESIGFCRSGNVQLGKEKSLPVRKNRCSFNFDEMAIEVVHSRMTTHTLRLRLSKERWAPVAQFHNAKQDHFESVFFDDAAGPEGSVKENRCLSNTSHRLQWSKEQCEHTSGENCRILLANWNKQSLATK